MFGAILLCEVERRTEEEMADGMKVGWIPRKEGREGRGGGEGGGVTDFDAAWRINVFVDDIFNPTRSNRLF